MTSHTMGKMPSGHDWAIAGFSLSILLWAESPNAHLPTGPIVLKNKCSIKKLGWKHLGFVFGFVKCTNGNKRPLNGNLYLNQN